MEMVQMKVDFSNEFDDAKMEAGRFDIDDFFATGSHYFECGYSNECYYNHSIAVAIAIIGKLYGLPQDRGSNYHKGVAYIAEEVDLSKRQVKVLRKKMAWRDGYTFKTSYKIYEIILKMCELLDAKKEEPIVMQYLQQQTSDMYREILIAEQYAAIRAAASRDKRVNEEVRGKLEDLTKRAR